MTTFDSTGFSAFDRVRELARRTRELLDVVVREGELPDGGVDLIAGQTLPHLENVQAGFRGSLRTEGVGIAELQYLLRQLASLRVEPPATDVERRAAAAETDAEARFRQVAGRAIEPIRVAEAWDLAALAHARLVLALLPRLEPDHVHWPAGRPTYADIPAPRGPAELAERLSELERQLWQAATGRPASRHDPAFRRTYGFFDAADWLGGQGLGRVA